MHTKFSDIGSFEAACYSYWFTSCGGYDGHFQHRGLLQALLKKQTEESHNFS